MLPRDRSGLPVFRVVRPGIGARVEATFQIGRLGGASTLTGPDPGALAFPPQPLEGTRCDPLDPSPRRRRFGIGQGSLSASASGLLTVPLVGVAASKRWDRKPFASTFEVSVPGASASPLPSLWFSASPPLCRHFGGR